MKHLVFGAMLLAGPALAEDGLQYFGETDPEMNDAISQARETLPLFFDNVLDAAGAAHPDALVKVGMPTISGEATLEHIWIGPFQKGDDSTFSGALANEPVELGALRLGDRVEFKMDQISDWSLWAPDGLMYGNYTTRVMFNHGAFGNTPFEAVFNPNQVPEGWR